MKVGAEEVEEEEEDPEEAGAQDGEGYVVAGVPALAQAWPL